MAQLLIIDHEKSLCQMLENVFRKEGHLVETVSSGQAAKKKIDSQVYDLIISGIHLPDLAGIELLEFVRETRNPAAFILMIAMPTMSTAIDALNLGAYQYIIKTDKLVEELKLTVNRALEELAKREENVRLRRELLRVFAQNNIIGASRQIQSILEMVRTVAPTTSTVLLAGESGTGKELVARAIHAGSLRREKLFVSIDCGAFPEPLLESKLFGYLKDALTGAKSNRKGIIESARGGTLVLDEIGEISLGKQVRLLQVLQGRTVRTLGGSREVGVDVRLIASTSRDLKKMVANGQFREEFYYYVSVIPIHVPPLRERPRDIEPLARHFLRRFALQMGKGVLDFAPDVLEVLKAYAWPGNIRELENAIEHAVTVSSGHSGRLSLDRLPQSVRSQQGNDSL
jgi:DNA-binding NtrC family response regulator